MTSTVLVFALLWWMISPSASLTWLPLFAFRHLRMLRLVYEIEYSVWPGPAFLYRTHLSRQLGLVTPSSVPHPGIYSRLTRKISQTARWTFPRWTCLEQMLLDAVQKCSWALAFLPLQTMLPPILQQVYEPDEIACVRRMWLLAVYTGCVAWRIILCMFYLSVILDCRDCVIHNRLPSQLTSVMSPFWSRPTWSPLLWNAPPHLPRGFARYEFWKIHSLHDGEVRLRHYRNLSVCELLLIVRHLVLVLYIQLFRPCNKRMLFTL